jgi:hypothetical protein
MARVLRWGAVTMRRLALFSLLLASACASGDAGDEVGDDLPLGDLDEDDGKADGNWGYATQCKDIPDLPPLRDPHITISLDGLSLHLVDRAGDYDRVFPVGVGVINNRTTSAYYGESETYYPLHASGRQDFTIDTTTNWTFNPCRVWWTDSDTGERLPVFAGLPFMRWSGSYGIHGPITNYRKSTGGDLERGYVSHGCVRMEAADVVEVYARISGTASVPVHVQREPERAADGARVDVDPWIGSECSADSDCAFDGGYCHANAVGERGFCTRACTQYCTDRFGSPTTFCVADPADSTRGMCVPQETSNNAGCRPYDHLVPQTLPRFNEPTRTSTVCVPGSRGWIGDRCLADADCHPSNHCDAGGFCTQGCSQYCPDEVGRPTTFCADGGSCARQCTPASNASECAAGADCVERSRNGDASTQRYVCEAS